METVEIREITPEEAEKGLQISAEQQLCAFSDRYAGRGVAKSVQEAAERQIEKEAATKEIAPDAYRLSSLSEGAVMGCYRHGKENMSASDLLLYFRETRQKRMDQTEFDENTGIDELPAKDLEMSLSKRAEQEKSLVPAARISGAIQTTRKNLKEALPTWFDSSKPDTSKERKAFPLSAFASMIAIAVSLMLIVASSVLLMRAETRVSALKEEILTAHTELTDLQADLEIRDDLRLIRRIAMEEYGMVGEEYVRMQYLTLTNEDLIEVYEEEKEQAMELSALLSAIGVK